MGIDHSNPYIHSTTVLCDIVLTFVSLLAGPPALVAGQSFREKGQGPLEVPAVLKTKGKEKEYSSLFTSKISRKAQKRKREGSSSNKVIVESNQSSLNTNESLPISEEIEQSSVDAKQSVSREDPNPPSTVIEQPLPAFQDANKPLSPPVKPELPPSIDSNLPSKVSKQPLPPSPEFIQFPPSPVT